jgi:hypothetical protein
MLPGLAVPRSRSAGSQPNADFVHVKAGYDPDGVYTVHLSVSPIPHAQLLVALPLLNGV